MIASSLGCCGSEPVLCGGQKSRESGDDLLGVETQSRTSTQSVLKSATFLTRSQYRHTYSNNGEENEAGSCGFFGSVRCVNEGVD